MEEKQKKLSVWQLRSNYFTTIVSITLVLFLIGLLGLLVLTASDLSQHVKENLGFTVLLKSDAQEAEIFRMQKSLDAKSWVLSTEFVTKVQAAEMMKKDLGEDFVSTLGYNPLSASLNVRVKSAYANIDSLNLIKENISASTIVKEIVFQDNLINAVNRNVRKISVILGVFSLLLLIICVALINNTIRLAVYAKRFIIRTMKLVGATYGFIRRPFVYKGIMQGIIGALVAIWMLASVIYYIQQEINQLISMEKIGYLFLSVILAGILIAGTSTFFAVNKYLKIKPDDLYY